MAYADEERDKVALVEFSIAVQREINVRCHHFKPADGGPARKRMVGRGAGVYPAS